MMCLALHLALATFIVLHWFDVSLLDYLISNFSLVAFIEHTTLKYQSVRVYVYLCVIL